MHDVIKSMEVRPAIDDFGTGYSSLSSLKRFPSNTLKIDQSFVRDIATDADDATIVTAVIGLGKTLKQRGIAEDVETHAQLAFLQAMQCDDGQGFHFSHPVAAEDFTRLLVAKNTAPKLQLSPRTMYATVPTSPGRIAMLYLKFGHDRRTRPIRRPARRLVDRNPDSSRPCFIYIWSQP